MQMLLKGSMEACVADPCPNQEATSVRNGTSWKISAGFCFSKCRVNEVEGATELEGEVGSEHWQGEHVLCSSCQWWG